MSDKIRNQINDIIEGEIQLGINDYLEEKQEKEDLNTKYSTSLVKENCNQEEMKDKSLPSDAYIVSYKVDDAVRKDLVRCHGKVNIFDMYYDKFGAGSIVSIEYGPGIVSPKTWGVPSVNKPKKRVRRNS